MKNLTRDWKIGAIALVIYGLDQLTKLLVLQYMEFQAEKEILPGFFRFVHWGNTGAAYSMFTGSNLALAFLGMAAIVMLVLKRHHFGVHTLTGQISLGLILGGILGNVTDRFRIGHVVDFLYFYLIRSDSLEAGFPAFNVADTAICVGVGLLFILSLKPLETAEAPPASVEDH